MPPTLTRAKFQGAVGSLVNVRFLPSPRVSRATIITWLGQALPRAGQRSPRRPFAYRKIAGDGIARWTRTPASIARLENCTGPRLPRRCHATGLGSRR
jgi:hypothetical protein